MKNIFFGIYIMGKGKRHYPFTLNNYTDEDEAQLQALKYSYLVYGYEVAPTTGTPHLQGHVYMKENITMSALSKHVPRCSWREVYKHSTPEASIDYCKKGGNYKEFGKPPKQGARKDLEELKNEILEGKTVDEIVMEKPIMYHQYGRTLQKIEDIRMRKKFRKEMTQGIWYYGETACGKSSMAFKDFNPDTHYVWSKEVWQDGYTQQDTVIIDEFRGHIKFSDLLTMIDIHPNCYVYRRGRERLPFTSKKVIITSSLRPEEVYCNLSVNDNLQQLLRRIKVEYLGKNT